MFPTTGKEFTRRVPDDFVPRSFLSGNSEERLEPRSGSHRAPSGSGASPGLPAPRGPAVSPFFPRAAVEIPRWRFPGPRGERVSVAAFRFCQLLPRQLGSLLPTGPHVCSQRGAALGSCPCRQEPGVPASGCLEAHGSKHTSVANTPRGRQGQQESGVCVAARVGRGLLAAPPCVCASFCA